MWIHIHIILNPFHFQKMPKEMLTECLSCSLFHNESRWRPGLKEEEKKSIIKVVSLIFKHYFSSLLKSYESFLSEILVSNNLKYHLIATVPIDFHCMENSMKQLFLLCNKKSFKFWKTWVGLLTERACWKLSFIDYILRDFINTTLA